MKKLIFLIFVFSLSNISYANAENMESLPLLLGGSETCSDFIKVEVGDDVRLKTNLEFYYIGYTSELISMENFSEWNKMGQKVGGRHGESFHGDMKKISDFILQNIKSYCINSPQSFMGSAAMDVYNTVVKNNL